MLLPLGLRAAQEASYSIGASGSSWRYRYGASRTCRGRLPSEVTDSSSLPLAGDILAAGKTPPQLKKDIEESMLTEIHQGSPLRRDRDRNRGANGSTSRGRPSGRGSSPSTRTCHSPRSYPSPGGLPSGPMQGQPSSSVSAGTRRRESRQTTTRSSRERAMISRSDPATPL
ncbi:MAG: polysaccharide biosynthesis/export family protein [Anaerotruncus sp.]|nr:polysaccharide biosynthesis/export family protein [Anaerotruncus sp.]